MTSQERLLTLRASHNSGLRIELPHDVVSEIDEIHPESIHALDRWTPMPTPSDAVLHLDVAQGVWRTATLTWKVGGKPVSNP